jgi:hypothetical protein
MRARARASEVQLLSRALREQGATGVSRHMKKRIKEAAEPVAEAARAAARRLPDRSTATRREGGSLRRYIAGSVTVRQTAKGVRIFVDSKKMPADARQMAHAFEGASIRHPVFGNRQVWVAQPTGGPWFLPTVRRHHPDFVRAVSQIIDDVKREAGL